MLISSRPARSLALGMVLALVTACSAVHEHAPAAHDPEMDSLVTAEWLAAHLDAPDLVVIDCTVAVKPDGAGGVSVISGRDTYEQGHIPTATNLPMTSLVDESGRFRPRDELETLLAGERDARTITYCGGGIAASANAFIMTRLGYKDVAVYAASLQEWAADESLPMARAQEVEPKGN